MKRILIDAVLLQSTNKVRKCTIGASYLLCVVQVVWRSFYKVSSHRTIELMNMDGRGYEKCGGNWQRHGGL